MAECQILKFRVRVDHLPTMNNNPDPLLYRQFIYDENTIIQIYGIEHYLDEFDIINIELANGKISEFMAIASKTDFYEWQKPNLTTCIYQLNDNEIFKFYDKNDKIIIVQSRSDNLDYIDLNTMKRNLILLFVNNVPFQVTDEFIYLSNDILIVWKTNIMYFQLICDKNNFIGTMIKNEPFIFGQNNITYQNGYIIYSDQIIYRFRPIDSKPAGRV